MAISAADRETILKAIESWPVEEQVSLAQDILRHAQAHGTTPQRPSSRDMYGVAATDRPPPSDAEVEQELDEHRSAKYRLRLVASPHH